MSLASLIELKLAAGRIQDETDVAQLIRANRGALDAIRQHLAAIHPDYSAAFERLVQRAEEMQDR